MNQIYLIRHGETDWNRQGRFQGQIDIPLNALGLWQAKQLPKWFGKITLDQIFSSDLKRTYETAKVLSDLYTLPIITRSTLRERSFGSLEGKHRDEVEALFKTTRVEELVQNIELQIEAYYELQQRISLEIQEIIANYPNQQIAVISHGAAINAFLSRISHGKIGTGKTRLDNTSVTHVATDGRDWKIHKANDISHLSQEGQHEVS